MTETAWPTEPKIFTICFFTKKFANPFFSVKQCPLYTKIFPFEKQLLVYKCDMEGTEY